MIMGVIAGNTQHGGRTNRGYAESWTSEQLDGLLSEAWLKEMVMAIRAGDEKKKDLLPYICPHYAAFSHNHRAQKDIIPEAFTFMTCVDVDDKTLVDQAIQRALELNKDAYSDWHDQVLRIEYSARRKVHIYIRIPKGKTIEEAQRAFCKEIEVPYDESCITPERFIYVTGRDEEVYRSAHWLEAMSDEELEERREAYLQRGLDVDGRKLKADVRGKMDDVRESPTLNAPSPQSLAAFDLCAEQAGLNPNAMDVWGEHNWHANLMAVLSVGVGKLMNREQLNAVVAQRMPNYAETEDCRKLIDYFYDKYSADKGFMNASLREINAKVQENVTKDCEATLQSLVEKPSFCYTKAVTDRMPLDELRALVFEPLPASAAVLDIDTGGWRKTDDEVIDFFKAEIGILHIQDILLMDKDRQRDAIRQARSFGASIRQLERLTGLSFSFITRM